MGLRTPVPQGPSPSIRTDRDPSPRVSSPRGMEGGNTRTGPFEWWFPTFGILSPEGCCEGLKPSGSKEKGFPTPGVDYAELDGPLAWLSIRHLLLGLIAIDFALCWNVSHPLLNLSKLMTLDSLLLASRFPLHATFEALREMESRNGRPPWFPSLSLQRTKPNHLKAIAQAAIDGTELASDTIKDSPLFIPF